MVDEVSETESDSRDPINPRLEEFRRVRQLPLKERRKAILAIIANEFDLLEAIYLEGIAILEAKEEEEAAATTQVITE